MIMNYILILLKNGRMSAGDITNHFNVTNASISRHLSVLKEATRQYGLEKVGVVATPCQVQGLRKAKAYPFTRFVAGNSGAVVKLVQPLNIYW